MKQTLDEFIALHKRNKEKSSDFVTYLYELMNKYGFDDAATLYTKANVSRQLWSSIISNKSNPSLKVCIKLVFTLKANNHECKYLLKKAGYTLSSSNTYSLIIRYCIESEIYDLAKLNDILIENGYQDSLID